MNAIGSQIRTRAVCNPGQFVHLSSVATSNSRIVRDARKSTYHLPKTNNCRIGNADQSSPAPLRCLPCKQAGRLNIVNVNESKLEKKEKEKRTRKGASRSARKTAVKTPLHSRRLLRAQFQRNARGEKVPKVGAFDSPLRLPQVNGVGVGSGSKGLRNASVVVWRRLLISEQGASVGEVFRASAFLPLRLEIRLPIR